MARTIVCLLLFSLTAPLLAQPTAGDRVNLRGSAEPTRKRLEDAAKKLAAGNTADAVEDLQRLLSDAGDDFTTTDGSHFRAARWQAHALLATLPAPALASYRDRIDGPARLLLDQARRDRDPAPLWSLLDRYFVSTPAEEALVLLGDMLFERGEVRTAEVVWKRLLPGGDIVYPTPSKTKHAAYEARVVLAAIYQGETERARAGLEALTREHPTATGLLAGVNGPYVSTLAALLEKPPTFPRDPRLPLAWPTAAAGPNRDGRIHGHLPHHWPSRPTWVFNLPPQRPFVKGPRLPGYDPVIVGGRVLISDGTLVYSLDRRTGDKESVLLEPEATSTFLPTDATRIFLRGLRTNSRGLPETSLVSLAFRPGGTLEKLWSVKAPRSETGTPLEFQGPPLSARRRLWAVAARSESGRVVHALVCYEPAERLQPPTQPAWLTEICDASSSTEETRRNVPTLAGRHIVACSHTGAVVALDAVTGQRSWAFRYPRVANPSLTTELSPPVYHAGRVIVAPADSDRLFALDAETGELLWESGPCEGAQILGITRGRVIVASTAGVRSLRGLSVLTGSQRHPEGWVQHRSSLPAAFGSGLVTDDAILWPTRSGLFFLHPETGEPLGAPLRPHRDPLDTLQPPATFGPIAFADGCLTVIVPAIVNGAPRDQVWGYVLERSK